MLTLKILHQFMCHLLGDFTLIIKVGHVADEVNHYILVGILLDFGLPVPHILVAINTCDIKDHDYGMSSFVKDLSDISKTFLSSSVPYLQTQDMILSLDKIASKFDTNGNIMVLLKGILG